MRLLIPILFCTLFINFSQAQPINDNCDMAIDLGSTSYCDTVTLFNNIGATASEVGRDNQPDCFLGGASDHDVWFVFTTGDAIEYNFTIQGVPDSTINDTFGLFNPEVAFYTGGCDSSELEMVDTCFSAPNQVNFLNFTLTRNKLQPNTTYYMRLNASGVGGINNGSFYICMEEVDDMFSIDEGGASLCSGQLYDTGGPNEDYGNNESYIFTICPDSAHLCITLNMGSYELDGMTMGDYFKIYDGSDTSGTLIGSSSDMRDTTGKTNPMDVNNAVCQMFFASSGCMTILWVTDSIGVAPGFDARWECSQDSCPSYDSLSLTVNPDHQEIINNIQGRLIDISVDSINCADSAYAVFNGSNSDLGMDMGLLLTTGNAAFVGRPNMLPDMGFNNDTTGIDLLDSLSLLIYGDTTTTHDGCSVDLDFVPETDVIALDLTMGSEEYPECIDTQMTDLIGLFYTTMGYNGDPRLNNHDNIARLPGADSIDIQIATINPGDSMRWIYYRNMLNSQSIEYDGMIANGNGGQKYVLITQNVEPCQANELITAIADRGDSLYDSGIMISNIRCLTPELSFSTSTGLPFFIETCNPGDDFINITYPRTYEQDAEWTVRFEGQAEEGVDFIWPSGMTIVQPAGEKTVQYPIDVINDNIDEGMESFIIKLSRDWGCGEVELTEIEVIIRDELVVEIRPEGDFCKGDSLILNSNPMDHAYLNLTWSPEDLFTNPDLNVNKILLDEDVQIILTGTIIGGSGCQWFDTIDINVIDPQIEVVALDSTGICSGETVRLQSTDNVSGTNRMWFPNQNISSTTDAMVTVNPTQTTTYSVTVDTANCSDTASIVIDVETLAFPDVIGDTTICAGEFVVLGRLTNPNNQSIYQWFPSTDLNDPTIATPRAQPTDTITYRLNARTTRGYCEDSAVVTVNVIDIGVDIVANSDSIFICLGDTTTIMAQTRGQGMIQWSPGQGVIGSTTGEVLTVNPDQTTTYTVVYSSERCQPMDRITVVVDELPEGLTVDPDAAPYCRGDSVSISVNFGNVSARNPEFQWSGGLFSGQGTPTIKLSAGQTRTYTVEVINGACEGAYSQEIVVVDFATDAGVDTVLCAGDTAFMNPVIPSDSLIQLYGEDNISYRWEIVDSSKLDILDPDNPNTGVVVRPGGGSVKFIVKIGSCEFESVRKLESSRPGNFRLVVDIDSIANCAIINANLEVTNPTGIDILEESIVWTFTDENGQVQTYNDEDLTWVEKVNKSGELRIEFTDENGCFHTDSRELVVDVPEYRIPNAFTPNGDGMNDRFRVVFDTPIEFEISRFEVMNRWGQRVFESNNNSGWDGRNNGEGDPVSEVYLYIIQFKDACGDATDIIMGDVTLVK